MIGLAAINANGVTIGVDFAALNCGRDWRRVCHNRGQRHAPTTQRRPDGRPRGGGVEPAARSRRRHRHRRAPGAAYCARARCATSPGRCTNGSIVVSGTNGKTTTTRLISHILRGAGMRPIHNRAGANLLSGLFTAVAQGTDWQARPLGDVGLFEVDEATIPARAAAHPAARAAAAQHLSRSARPLRRGPLRRQPVARGDSPPARQQPRPAQRRRSSGRGPRRCSAQCGFRVDVIAFYGPRADPRSAGRVGVAAARRRCAIVPSLRRRAATMTWSSMGTSGTTPVRTAASPGLRQP